MIKFGTSGWRGLIARDFTFENVRLAAQGIADYLNSETANPRSAIFNRQRVVILGHDTRFLGREFSLAAAEVLAANGLSPLLCDRDTPTPAIAHAIRDRKAAGGINMTASHNPAEYQGLKFSTHNGAPASPEVTKQIEANIAQLLAHHWSFSGAVVGRFQCKTFAPQPAYFKQVRKLVNFTAIRKARLKVAVELMYGTGRGLGLDGDADRFGIVDQSGAWLTPNQVLALTLYHLKRNRGWTGAVARTVPTSHQVDAVAELFGVKVHETPVGFKYIGALMESEPIIVGGEESGGLSVKGHVPEKDGILACLLMAELIATEEKPLGQIPKELEKRTGEFHTGRVNLMIPPEKKAALLNKLSAGPARLGPFKVEKFIATDGYKFLLPGGEWIAFRASGTEPLVRCYLEAKSAAHLNKLRKVCRRLLQLDTNQV